MVDHGRLLDAIGYEARLLGEASRAVPAETGVPTCPGWTVCEVVRHVGSVHRAAVRWLEDGRRPERWQRDPARGQTVWGYLSEGAVVLSDRLASLDPHSPVATWWSGDPTAGFWSRRMAHETTVHRVDVERAAGRRPAEVPDDVALDGVDEALRLWLGHRLSVLGVTGTRCGAVEVRTAGVRWMARMTPNETVVSRSAGDGVVADAVVSGLPDDVYLWLWGRRGPGAITVEGDEDAVGQLWALMRLATR